MNERLFPMEEMEEVKSCRRKTEFASEGGKEKHAKNARKLPEGQGTAKE